ncbi:MAG: histidinol-phosphate transaminase, partial [Desulfatiglandales bacterium]
PSPKAIHAVKEALSGLNRYPDGSAYYLRQAISKRFHIPFDQVLIGNGSNEIIELAVRTFLLPFEKAVQPFPTFLVYEKMVAAQQGIMVNVPLKGFGVDLDAIGKSVEEDVKLIFINNPNNPTGTYITHDEMEAFLRRLPKEVVVILDEAYIEFSTRQDIANGLELLREFPNLIVLRTFSKLYGLAGLRIGYGFTSQRLADYMNRVRQPFNVNTLAQKAALAALEDEEFVNRTIALVRTELAFLKDGLDKLGLRHFPTQTNFFLVEVGDADRVYKALLQEGVIVRSMSGFGLERFIRISVGLREENIKFLNALKRVLGIGV